MPKSSPPRSSTTGDIHAWISPTAWSSRSLARRGTCPSARSTGSSQSSTARRRSRYEGRGPLLNEALLGLRVTVEPPPLEVGGAASVRRHRLRRRPHADEVVLERLELRLRDHVRDEEAGEIPVLPHPR